jgi:hypothetical protein
MEEVDLLVHYVTTTGPLKAKVVKGNIKQVLPPKPFNFYQ